MEILADILAQTAPTQTQPTQQPGGGSAALFLPAMMVALIAFMLLTARSQRKRERREREELNSRLAKNHRVLTIGGVIGTVVAVKENEVVVKVDESTNTKMTFLKSAIQRILTDDAGATLEGKG